MSSLLNEIKPNSDSKSNKKELVEVVGQVLGKLAVEAIKVRKQEQVEQFV